MLQLPGTSIDPHDVQAGKTSQQNLGLGTNADADFEQALLTRKVDRRKDRLLGELGLTVTDGRVSFRGVLLRESELLSEGESFEYYDVDGKPQTLVLAAGTLAFTYCQVPIVYRRDEQESLTLYLLDGTVQELSGSVLDTGLSREIFARSGKIVRVDVSLPTVGELLCPRTRSR